MASNRLTLQGNRYSHSEHGSQHDVTTKFSCGRPKPSGTRRYSMQRHTTYSRPETNVRQDIALNKRTTYNCQLKSYEGCNFYDFNLRNEHHSFINRKNLRQIQFELKSYDNYENLNNLNIDGSSIKFLISKQRYNPEEAVQIGVTLFRQPFNEQTKFMHNNELFFELLLSMCLCDDDYDSNLVLDLLEIVNSDGRIFYDLEQCRIRALINLFRYEEALHVNSTLCSLLIETYKQASIERIAQLCLNKVCECCCPLLQTPNFIQQQDKSFFSILDQAVTALSESIIHFWDDEKAYSCRPKCILWHTVTTAFHNFRLRRSQDVHKLDVTKDQIDVMKKKIETASLYLRRYHNNDTSFVRDYASKSLCYILDSEILQVHAPDPKALQKIKDEKIKVDDTLSQKLRDVLDNLLEKIRNRSKQVDAREVDSLVAKINNNYDEGTVAHREGVKLTIEYQLRCEEKPFKALETLKKYPFRWNDELINLMAKATALSAELDENEDSKIDRYHELLKCHKYLFMTAETDLVIGQSNLYCKTLLSLGKYTGNIKYYNQVLLIMKMMRPYLGSINEDRPCRHKELECDILYWERYIKKERDQDFKQQSKSLEWNCLVMNELI